MIKRFHQDYINQWDSFVKNTKNGTFLFERSFMDYHSDRFLDHSLMIFNSKGTLIALFPATENGDEIVSHGGLTYGGLLYTIDNKMSEILQILEDIVNYYGQRSFKTLIYKAIPHIYHSYPSEEDLYGLYRLGATLIRRDISQTIDWQYPRKLSKGRKWMLNKARKAQVEVRRSDNFKEFMAVEAATLEKYGVKPVHSSDEILLLASRFPDNIKLFEASINHGPLLAGVLIFESSTVAHAQYIGSTAEGKSVGATELIVEYILENEIGEKKYFDFGISTEQQGEVLNTGLTAFKETFGARGISYDFYRINL